MKPGAECGADQRPLFHSADHRLTDEVQSQLRNLQIVFGYVGNFGNSFYLIIIFEICNVYKNSKQILQERYTTILNYPQG